MTASKRERRNLAPSDHPLPDISALAASMHRSAARTARSKVLRSTRTRAAALAAAEDLFAKHGFSETRLEDVAEAVQVTRAALFYYFPDKQSLFNEMLRESFGPLSEQLLDLLSTPNDTITERIEKAVMAWIDAIVSRPARARILLRLVADGTDWLAQGVLSDNNQIAQRFWALFEQGCRTGELKPLAGDAFHTASAVIGTTVFYVAALTNLLPPNQFRPVDPCKEETHKKDALNAVRHLLGLVAHVDAQE